MARRKPTYADWPPRMLAAMAAGYCGEPDVKSFLERVSSGKYPKPYLVETAKRKWWLKEHLDQSMGITPIYDDNDELLSMGEKFIEAQNRRRQSGTA